MIAPARRDWAIVFDLDDTLYPESDFVFSGYQAVDQELQRRGITGFEPLAKSLFQQGLRGNIFDVALAKLGRSPDPGLITELVQLYRSHTPQLSLFPDARRVLNQFLHDTKVGLLTDGYAATQRNKVKALGLDTKFAAYMYTDDLGREGWKPSPLPFLTIAAMLGMESSVHSLVYVADNPVKDFIAPNELGWMTVQIRRPGGEYSTRQPAKNSHAAKFDIPSLEELPAILG